MIPTDHQIKQVRRDLSVHDFIPEERHFDFARITPFHRMSDVKAACESAWKEVTRMVAAIRKTLMGR